MPDIHEYEVHDVLRHWRRVADSYEPARLLLGETHFFDLEELVSFYGRGDELQLAFNFCFVHAPLAAPALRDVVEQTEALLPSHATPCWTMGNHDVSRYPTRWGDNDPPCEDGPRSIGRLRIRKPRATRLGRR